MSTRRKSNTGHPGRQSRPPKAANPLPPEQSLTIAVLALTEAALETVKESEVRIRDTVRAGDDPADALAIHLNLRTGALGFLSAYAQLTGQPDPTA